MLQLKLETFLFPGENVTITSQSHELPFASCVSFGPNYYRTLDGMAYFFDGKCTYLALTDELSTFSVELKPVGCESYSTCRKVPVKP